jgi:hypothetical protein
MRIAKYLIIGLLAISNLAMAKVRIISSAYNRPDLIELQYRCLKEFVLDDYEQVLFNDAEDPKHEVDIAREAAKYGIRCVRVPQEIVHKNHQVDAGKWGEVFAFDTKRGSAPYRVNFRCGEVLQYAFEQVGINHDDILIIMDLDCFPIAPVSFREILGDAQMAGIIWRMPPDIAGYPMPIFMGFDIPKLPHKEAINFNSGFVGSKWYDLCALLQFYVFCHDIKIKDYYTLGHVHCSRLGKLSRDELLHMGYDELTIQFVQKYFKMLFTNLGYQAEANINYDQEPRDPSRTIILDQGQILERTFFHYNQCTNWAGAYDSKFMKAKNKLIKDFVYSVTSP